MADFPTDAGIARTSAQEAELQQLIREQERDDTHHAERERYDGKYTLSLDAVGESTGFRSRNGASNDGLYRTFMEDPYEIISQEIGDVSTGRTEAATRVVAEALTAFKPEWVESYHLRYGEGLSLREVAKRQGLSDHKAVTYRLTQIKRKVYALIAEEEGW